MGPARQAVPAGYSVRASACTLTCAPEMAGKPPSSRFVERLACCLAGWRPFWWVTGLFTPGSTGTRASAPAERPRAATATAAASPSLAAEGLGGHGGFLLSLGGIRVHTHETGRRGYVLQPVRRA